MLNDFDICFLETGYLKHAMFYACKEQLFEVKSEKKKRINDPDLLDLGPISLHFRHIKFHSQQFKMPVNSSAIR